MTKTHFVLEKFTAAKTGCWRNELKVAEFFQFDTVSTLPRFIHRLLWVMDQTY